ncbi:MAG TPA: hypothetical protein VMW42_12880 [Desulfatiglandales bacterium]|nr:hypothetical protein [Desulfatiglandales bacterium]
MPIKWKNKKNLNPDVVLNKIKNIATVQKDGKVSFPGFEYIELMPAIYSMIDFNRKMDWSIKKEIISSGIKNSIRKNIVTREGVIKELNNQLKEINRKKEEIFFFLTTISIKQPLPIKTLDILNCNIRIFLGSYPKKYESRRKYEDNWRFNFKHTPSDYSKIIVKCKAQLPKEAVRKSLEALDLFRSILCLYANSRQEITYGTDARSPINKIRLGGLHTLHKKDGKNAVDYFWYEPNFSLAKPYCISNANYKLFNKNIKWAIKQLSKSKYKTEIQDGLLRYVRALDENDANTAAIKLWGALESIAASGGNNYELVTRRCAFLFKDNIFHKQMLEHLREYRNNNIHAGEEFEEARTCCYQMQYYFYRIVVFHLYYADFFSNLDEANYFLDMPSDSKLLERRKTLIEEAIKFTSPVA